MILKTRDITLLTKVCIVKAMVFPVVMYGCESWTIKKAECRRITAFQLWCWRRLLRVSRITRRSNQPILRKSILNIHWKDWCWSSNTLVIWCKELTRWKRPWHWARLGQEEMGVTEDEILGWHHRLNGYVFEQTLEVSEGQGSLAWCSPWHHKELDRAEWLNNNNDSGMIHDLTELSKRKAIPKWLPQLSSKKASTRLQANSRCDNSIIECLEYFKIKINTCNNTSQVSELQEKYTSISMKEKNLGIMSFQWKGLLSYNQLSSCSVYSFQVKKLVSPVLGTTGQVLGQQSAQETHSGFMWPWFFSDRRGIISTTSIGSFHKTLILMIRGQTERKPQSQKTNQTDHIDHNLV